MCCGWKNDVYGTSVEGLVHAGDAQMRSNNNDGARQSYKRALETLKETGGCGSCISFVQRKLNLTY